MCRSNSDSWYGLPMKAFTPSAAARLRCFSAVRDEMMMIGMPRVRGSPRRLRVRSKPSMRGISMSMSITSGRQSLSFSIASRPSFAVITR